MDEIYISTGKELLDSKITKFEVLNGCWIGEIGIQNIQPHLYCSDYNGNLVNSFPLSNKTILNLRIKPIKKNDILKITAQDPLIKKVVGWRPIVEYDETNEFLHGAFDWVLVKMFDGNHACIPVVAEKRRDGKWYDQNNNELPFEVREFFDMKQLDKEDV